MKEIIQNIPILTKDDIEGIREHELERLDEALNEGRIELVWYITIKKEVQQKAEQLLNNLNN